MRKFFVLVSIVFITFSIYSCKTQTQSEVNQITAERFTCDINEEQAKYYYEKYGKNNSKITADEQLKRKAFEVLSNVPEEYLQFVIVKHNTPIILEDEKTYEGVTYLNFTGTGVIPTNIESDILVLSNQFGHAAQGYLWEKYPDFLTNLNELARMTDRYSYQLSTFLRLYRDNSTNSKDSAVFAALFDTYYCSKMARQQLEKDMPDIYRFAQKYLLPPVSSSN